MINFINSWAQGIILAVVIATLIEIILPDGNNKKYVKTILGIYILFVMVYPLLSKVSNKKINVQSIIDSATSQIDKYEINNNIAIETSSYIEKEYIQNLEKDLKEKLKEKDYDINSLNIDVETENEEKYGQINSITIQICKNEETQEDNRIKTNNVVEKVEIRISNDTKNSEVKNETITKEEIDNLKNYLSTTYGVDIEKIYINE